MSDSVKVYRMVITVLDFEGHGLDEAIGAIENAKYVNASVVESQEVTIKDWSDDHPLNQCDSEHDAINRLFKDVPVVYHD